jgi:anaerobic carbon-monoxide dehydrogenase iron sulfur subunit
MKRNESREEPIDRRFVETRFRKRRSLEADPKCCSGCRTCEMACSLSHGGSIDLERSRIYLKSNPFKGSFIPVICHHCSDAPCMEACPESAIEINREDGTVLIIDEKCNGCRLCERACPFRAIRFDEERRIVFKCDFCHGHPQCVAWCPTSTLGTAEFGGESPL